MRNSDLTGHYRRWHAAEADGAEDAADEEFKAVFAAAVAPSSVSAGFTARTMEAIAGAAAREARRSRRAKAATIAAGVVGGVTAAYFGAGFLIALVSGTLTGAFNLLIGGVVRMAGAAQTGADVWSLLTGVGRAAAAFVADPTVTMTLFALQGIAVAALIALQRLLGADTDEESLQ